MKPSVLFYAVFYKAPEFRDVAYVVAHYANGDIRYWYPETRGFKSAKAKALRSGSCGLRLYQ